MNSTGAPPSAGTLAVTKTSPRTRLPSTAATPGITNPPDEWPTSTTSSSPASSTSSQTERIQSARVTWDRSAGLYRRPGRSTANEGCTRCSTTPSHITEVDMLPWTSTKVGATRSALLVGDPGDFGVPGGRGHSFVAQLPLQHPAHRAAGELGAELDVAGEDEVGEAGDTPFEQLLRLQLRSRG